MMRKLAAAVVALILLAGLTGQAEAGFIFGSQAFASSATTSSPGITNINDTSFTLNFNTLLGGANQSDDYVGTFGTFVNALSTTTPLAFVFGNALYGTFTPTAVLTNSLIPNVSRTLQFSGTFSPNALSFPPGFDPTPGILTVTINQAKIGKRSVLSGSATLATAAVPEPSTVVLLATACPVAIVLMRLRKRRHS